MTLKLGVSGVRGIVGVSLTADLCAALSQAFATFVGGDRVIVATDTRPSRGELKAAVFKGLSAAGSIILDAGIIPTPTTGVLVKNLNANGAIVITASHNPSEWNGLKFIGRRGVFLNEEEAEKLFEIWRKGEFLKGDAITPRQLDGVFEAHLSAIFKNTDAIKIMNRGFKVAVDCVNGAGSKIIPHLLKDLGCQVVAINTDIDQTFPHNPEPTPENIKDLCRLVKRAKADIGFAIDPDADRLAIVSEKGEAIGEEYTLALAVEHVLRSKIKDQRSKVVVTNLSTTKAIDDIAAKYGAKVIRTKIGEINVVEEMIKQTALIGGEGNGGVIYPPITTNRDSLTAIALILEHMADSDSPISKILEGLPQYHIIKSKSAALSSGEDTKALLAKTREIYKRDDVNTLDGVKVLFKDGSWIHIRASNTEPVIRIIAEAASENEARSLVSAAAKELGVRLSGI